MPKHTNVLEGEREQVEGDLAVLGNTRVMISMAMERVRYASCDGQQPLLCPSLDDLAKAESLISGVQVRIAARLQSAMKW
jgi:hypothetical protein